MYAEISQIVPSGIICDALRELVPFAQFTKLEKDSWTSVTKNSTPPWVLFYVFKVEDIASNCAKYLT